ncbi:MAG: DUF58 domain-containing protein [Candidatus Muiribacteriota bacterium]
MKFLNLKELSSLKNLNFVAKTVVEGFLYGQHKSPYSGVNIEFSEYRPYTFGDELKNIDWKLWGKTDKLYVKKFEEETNMRVWILLDSSKSMFYGSDKITKLFYGKIMASALSYIFLNQQDSVGIADFSDSIKNIIPVSLKYGQFARIMNMLDKIEPGGTTDMDKTFSYFSYMVKKRGLIIIISDFLEKKENLIKTINYFKKKKNEIIVFQIFDKAEIEFPFSKEMVFIDSETGEKIQEDPYKIKETYIREFKRNNENIKKLCRENSINYSMICTEDDILKTIGQVFKG